MLRPMEKASFKKIKLWIMPTPDLNLNLESFRRGRCRPVPLISRWIINLIRKSTPKRLKSSRGRIHHLTSPNFLILVLFSPKIHWKVINKRYRVTLARILKFKSKIKLKRKIPRETRWTFLFTTHISRTQSKISEILAPKTSQDVSSRSFMRRISRATPSCQKKTRIRRWLKRDLKPSRLIQN